MKKGILLHKADDDVGVAAMNLSANEIIQAVTLDGEPVQEVTITEDIPLGHKVAMHPIESGKNVIEYGRPIGYASVLISAGAHVHTHNLKSLRWSGKSQLIEHN